MTSPILQFFETSKFYILEAEIIKLADIQLGKTSHGSEYFNVLWTLISDYSCRELQVRQWQLRRNISGNGSLASGDSESSTSAWTLRTQRNTRFVSCGRFKSVPLGAFHVVRCKGLERYPVEEEML